MAPKKSGKLRTEFRKKYQGRVRQADLTRGFDATDDRQFDDTLHGERLSGKGDLTRKRTVEGSQSTPNDAAGLNVNFDGADESLKTGRVLSVHGLRSVVLADDGSTRHCSVRQVLKSMATDQRNVIVAGDRVRFRAGSATDGVIHGVLPRHGLISRTSRKRQHVLAANIDAMMIIASATQPTLKPGLIDRFLLTAHHYEVQPIVVVNKVDLVDPVDLQPLVGVYASLGVQTLLVSAETGQNISYLTAMLTNRQTALAGQSGVGKSSLLNAVQPGLGLAVGRVSTDNDKGRHTTTAARLIPLTGGGAVFDTPGMRQFQLWDISAGEVAGLMPEMRPYVSFCRYPNCLHIAEDDCAVKNAVADARIDARRYDAYCHLLEEELL